jgi:signal transduction histidine kinase
MTTPDLSNNESDLESKYREQIYRLENEIQGLGSRLRESENCKSHFLSNIRNEINNPLASIIGLAASIHGVSTEEKAKRMGQLIYQQASALEFQMRNIIVAAELEVGDIKLCGSRVNVCGLLGNVTSYLRHKIVEHNINVQVQAEELLGFVTDARAFETICINLLANAVEFSGHRNSVVVDVKKTPGGLQISFTDFGSGIQPEVQRKLFQPFTQGDMGITKTHGGHGLGLSIVKELVSHLGGVIEFQSVVNTGTTVIVQIPELAVCNPQDQSDSGSELFFTSDEQF